MMAFVFSFLPTSQLRGQRNACEHVTKGIRMSQSEAPRAAVRVHAGKAVAAAAIWGAAAAIALGTLYPTPPVNALTAEDVRQLSYSQVKGTGLANRCPEVTSSKGKIALDKSVKYKIVDMCLEPKQFLVEEEVSRRRGESKREFVDTKLMTRATYTLGGVEGDLVHDGGSWKFLEKDGLDYAAATVQLPGGERVPFLFTIKRLVATLTGADDGISASTEMGGEFRVPSYRTGMFLDPKGRGMTAGYDMAVALPALEADGSGDQDKVRKENDKVFQETGGSIELAVNKVDPANNEIGGVFVSEQLSDTDMGAKPPKKLLFKGIFYARVEPAEQK